MQNTHSGRREDGFRINKKKTLTLKETKPKGWSHQNDLASAIGKKVRLKGDALMIEGSLVAADQFSLKVDHSLVPDCPKFIVVFKSALTSFEVIE